ncbi:hypothetical protein CMQ_7133 [Grosmannia clavigera kw1407]|uniref:Uncharacterized protein n=1 Tax=Grosmannia clavigera (strain kw1407 / UAMH 11150) TaxID=655863 RepID=F0XQE8_GROCL|nr:uncharacterized protein CMQ_7133 [Grosmannia clavigera kw1407]EFX00131.1 hypothetical protein CMQ_7133 [Grosmannia clavigera kw1407]
MLSKLENFVLKPTFRAIAVVLLAREFDYKSEGIGQLPVLIVYTGITEGLSRPISFKSIAQKVDCYYDVGDSEDGRNGAAKTTMETAIGFLMELDQTEPDVFGLTPDPDISLQSALGCDRECLIARSARLLYDARALGLDDKEDKVEGPSSQWVDTNIHTTWTGHGALSASSSLATESTYRKRYYNSMGLGSLTVRDPTLDACPKKISLRNGVLKG